MRIVSGEFKGRIFKPGKNFKARPTTDIAKEGLFNILTNQYDFEHISVLDLFSGTGSISYEFASRGSKNITLVESNFNHLKFINQVITQLQIKNIHTVRDNVFKYIKKHSEKFDIIFADPPFDLPNLKELPDLIMSSELLNSESLFILEHPKGFDFSDHPNFSDLRSYGNVHFSFFR